jgi:hypothetical protein
MPVSRLKRVPIREVWRNEEKDFTPWLEKNIDILAETLGIELSVVEREADVGEHFEADLLAEGPNGDYVVIENQFGKSDHDHLGKLITYLTNLEAKTALWICEDPQPEHIEAIGWLNKNTPHDTAFYLIKLEVFQIESSPRAPHFSIVSGPSKQIKEAGEVKGELAETHIRRLKFWRQLLEKSNKKTTLFSNVSPSKNGWIHARAGISGVKYSYIILMDKARVQLSIESGDADKNKRVFDSLYESKQQIENDFGEQLVWERLDNRKSSYIKKIFENKGLKDIDNWRDIQNRMVDAMIRLEKALSKHINKLT